MAPATPQGRAFPPLSSVPPLRAARIRQRRLFCPCGAPNPAGSEICPACQTRLRYSQSRFGGHRQAVLLRDGFRCQGCAAAHANPRRIHVHHRRPGHHVRKWLITLCAACHARVHRLTAVRHYLRPALVALWAEQHPQVPLQLQFDFPAAEGTSRG